MVSELLDSLSMLTLPTDYHGGSYSAALSSEEAVGHSAPPLQTIVQPPRTPLSITLLGNPLLPFSQIYNHHPSVDNSCFWGPRSPPPSISPCLSLSLLTIAMLQSIRSVMTGTWELPPIDASVDLLLHQTVA